MSTGIVGKKKESTGEFTKSVGMFEGRVVAINPDVEWLASNGIELKEGSKTLEYLGEKEGVQTCRVSVWVKQEKTDMLFNTNFFLENKERYDKDNTKVQYINDGCTSTWGQLLDGKPDESSLPEWFVAREYKIAISGEAELYDFLRNWLNLDWFDNETKANLDRKKLFKGNMKDLTEWIGTPETQTVCLSAEIKVSEKDGEPVSYQSVNSRMTLPGWCMKFFRTKKFDSVALDQLRKKAELEKEGRDSGKPVPKEQKLKKYERFAVQITDPEHGSKNFYSLAPLHEYVAEENLVASDRPISDKDDSY